MNHLNGKNITSIEELLSATGDRVNIMEEQIDVITQQNYTLLANFIQAHPDYERIRREFRENMDELFGDTLEKEQKKRMLVALADFAEPEVYRAIERFAAMNTPLKKWATVALQQSRIKLQTELLDDPGVFISTGLGGQGSLLRFFAVFLYKAAKVEDFQLSLLKNETEAAIRNAGGKTEQIKFLKSCTTVTMLMPLTVDLPDLMGTVLRECNQFGNFLNENMIITNVKKLTVKEIEYLKKKSPNRFNGIPRL